MLKIKKIFMICLCMSLFLSGCGLINQQKQFSWVEPFDTLTNLTLFGKEKDIESGYALADEYLTKYDQLFDIYNTYEGINNLKTVNDQAGIAPVKVDKELIDLVEFGIKMYQKTDGQINIAMGSVLKIWHDYRSEALDHPENAQVPQREMLVEAAKHANIDDIVIDREKSTIYLKDSKMSLDVGGIAKGYAAQKMIDDLKAYDYKGILLNMHSNIYAYGTKGDGTKWHLGIQNPDMTDQENPILFTISNLEGWMVTSGDYQRYFEVDGKKYHHIIDPDTLYPSDEFASITILAEDAAIADALSTALFCMSIEKGKEVIKTYTDVEVLWVKKDGTQEMTDGFKTIAKGEGK